MRNPAATKTDSKQIKHGFNSEKPKANELTDMNIHKSYVNYGF
jgi:hypothetical protein